MRKATSTRAFHEHAESMGRLRRLRKSRYSLNNPETWASANEKSEFRCSGGHVPGEIEEVRPNAEVCRDAHRRTRACASQRDGSRDRRGEISRAAARLTLGRKRSAVGERLPYHMGSRRF